MRVLYTLAFLIGLASAVTVEEATQKGVVTIQPSAFHSMRRYFSRMIVFVKGENNTDLLKDFVSQVQQVNSTVNDSQLLFGIINLEEDLNGVLQDYNLYPAIKIVTERNIYSFDDKDLKNLPSFYQKIMQPTLKVVDQEFLFTAKNMLIFEYPNASSFRGFQKMYHIIKEDLEEFDTQCVAQKKANLSVKLRLSSGETVLYESDPADIEEIVKFVNVETIPLVSNLSDDKSIHRVFGSGVQSQLIMILNQSIPESGLRQITDVLQKVAAHNKNEDLKYSRVIFAIAPTDYSHELMADLVQDLENSKFKIIITRTNYNAFTLQRFLYSEEQLTVQKLQQFLESYRMKRLRPFFRSEAKPESQKGDILKIVGKTFNRYIYGSKESTLVLFYDSKDKHQTHVWRRLLKEFVAKYKSHYGGDLTVGQFDLALNQHENLYLKYAPQLQLFAKGNKKQPSKFQGLLNEDTLKTFVNQGVDEFTLPDNPDQLLFLGGGEL